MLYKNMKAMVHTVDGDTDFFDIEAGLTKTYSHHICL